MRNGEKKMKRMAVILLSLLLLCGCGSFRPDQETGWEEAPQWKEGLPAQDPDQTPDSAPEQVPQDLSQLDTTQYSGAFGSFATLTDPTSGVPVLDAVVPYDWSAWVETDWQVYSTLNPCIAYVFFQSPDGQATVMFQTAHNYLQMYDTLGWFPHTDYNDTQTYTSHLAYKDAGQVLDLYFNGLLGTGGTVTGEEEVPSQLLEALDQAAEQALANTVNGLNSYGQNATALNYGGTAAIRRYCYTDGNGQTAVAQAIAYIRSTGQDKETIYTCYVVEHNRLLGVVSARSLMLAKMDTPITEIMEDNVVTVKVTDDQEFVSREMQRYDFTAMPVVDNEGMFVGIITIDDAIDVLTDESTEDMQKMAAILPDEDATTYFGTSVWTHAKQRIPWLLILMLSATFTGMVTTRYEAAFVSLPLLVSFMPMLMDTAGNCGNQVSTQMVRGLALDEIEPADFLKVVYKELRVSMIVGVVLGAANGLRIWLMYGVFGGGQYPNVMDYVVVVSLALFLSIILAKLVGGLLPLGAKKLGFDPAIMANPFLSTIVDCCSLLIYFQIATVVFRSYMG